MLICVKDGRALTVTQNSVYAEQLTEGKPYQVWSTDKYSCPECGFEVLFTAPEPSSRDFFDTYYIFQRRATLRFE